MCSSLEHDCSCSSLPRKFYFLIVIYLLIFPYLRLSHLKFSRISNSPKLKTQNLSLSLSQISVSLRSAVLSLRSAVLSLRSVGLYLRSMGAPDQWVVFVSNWWDFLYFISLSLNLVVEISVEIGGGTLQWWVCGLWFLLIWVFTLFKSRLVRRA